MRTFTRQVRLRATVEETWAFLRTPEALPQLTPPRSGVRVVTPGPVEEGGEVLLSFRALPGLPPMPWRSRFRDVTPPTGWVDVAVGLPFPLWEHHHRAFPEDGGCLVVDEVRYDVPLGALGHLLSGWRIRRVLEEQFRHRHDVLRARFGAR